MRRSQQLARRLEASLFVARGLNLRARHLRNSGDVAGDTSFVISRRTTAYECRKDPSNFMCIGGLAQFSGDDPNSTDLVLEWSLDIDGKWGPYLECNPLDAKKSLGGWECSNGMFGKGMRNMPKPPPNYPATCKAYKGGDGFCLNGFMAKTVRSSLVSRAEPLR